MSQSKSTLKSHQSNDRLIWGCFKMPWILYSKAKRRENNHDRKYPVQYLKILVDGSSTLTPFRLIPARRCRGGQFFRQLQLFGRRVLPAPAIGGCQPSRGEADRWASPINEGDKLTTNLGKEWQENHRETQEDPWYMVDQRQIIQDPPTMECCAQLKKCIFFGHLKGNDF